jgi:hypothetical protein
MRFAVVVGAALCVMGTVARQGSEAVGEHNYRQWIEFIRPNADEAKFMEIGWRAKFAAAIDEAKRLQRPILFWTMNGHPLGCT